MDATGGGDSRRGLQLRKLFPSACCAAPRAFPMRGSRLGGRRRGRAPLGSDRCRKSTDPTNYYHHNCLLHGARLQDGGCYDPRASYGPPVSSSPSLAAKSLMSFMLQSCRVRGRPCRTGCRFASCVEISPPKSSPDQPVGYSTQFDRVDTTRANFRELPGSRKKCLGSELDEA